MNDYREKQFNIRRTRKIVRILHQANKATCGAEVMALPSWNQRFRRVAQLAGTFPQPNRRTWLKQRDQQRDTERAFKLRITRSTEARVYGF